MSAHPRALVVDDHRLLAQSIALALGAEGVPCTVADLSDLDGVLAAAVADPPDVVLLDLDLGEDGRGGSLNGATLVGPLTEAGCRVVVVSASTDPVAIGAAVEAGAVGVLAKTEPVEVLLAATLAAARDEDVLGDPRRQVLLRHGREARGRRSAALAPFGRLTGREGHVLGALARGRTVVAIAREAHVSEATVRSQVRGVLTKLEVGSQLEAVALAHRAGWVSPSAR